MRTNCPNCSAPVDLSASKCPYCDTPYTDRPRMQQEPTHAAEGLTVTMRWATLAQALESSTMTVNEARAVLGLRAEF